MKSYEFTVVLRPETAEGVVQKVKETLEKFGVSIVSEDPWGLKKLAYEIDGETSGYYFFANIESPPESVEKIISEFRLMADVMRYMFVAAGSPAKTPEV